MGVRAIGCAGSTAVDYAIILPLLLMFMLGVADAGRLMWTYATLTRAIDATARCAAVDTIDCGTAQLVSSYAGNQLWGVDATQLSVTLASAACGKSVHGSYSFSFVTPFIWIAQPFGVSNSLTLTVSACYP